MPEPTRPTVSALASTGRLIRRPRLVTGRACRPRRPFVAVRAREAALRVSLSTEARAATRAFGTATVASPGSPPAVRCAARTSLRWEVADVGDVTSGVADGALAGGAKRCRPWYRATKRSQTFLR